ncbi:MAG: hypothetical protein J07HQX50_02421 [Haloquadratum sp. J07HQX50]|nr:MAG: hypothetical protein J07HQX50_02421 [Haloquadratum sp. J07HQX50]
MVLDLCAIANNSNTNSVVSMLEVYSFSTESFSINRYQIMLRYRYHDILCAAIPRKNAIESPFMQASKFMSRPCPGLMMLSIGGNLLNNRWGSRAREQDGEYTCQYT